MNDKPRDPGDPIEALVFQYLEHQAQTERCDALMERVLESVERADKETKAVKRLELRRSFRWRGDSRITFTLIDARTPEDSRYEPTGHLDEPYRILTRNLQLDRRSDALTSWFGPNAVRWIVEPSKSEAFEED